MDCRKFLIAEGKVPIRIHERLKFYGDAALDMSTFVSIFMKLQLLTLTH